MTTTLKGTLEQVKRQLEGLTFPPDAKLCVIIKAADAAEADCRNYEAEFADYPRRNGLIVMPLEYNGNPLTTEVVNSLSEDE